MILVVLVDEGAKDNRRHLILFLLEKTIWLLALPFQTEGLLQLALSHGWKSPPSPFIWLLLHSTEFGERRKLALH
jgi:hypothetical protein